MPQLASRQYVFSIYLNHGIPNAPQVPVRACDLNNPVFDAAARKADTPDGEVRREALVEQLANDARRRAGH